MKRNTLILLIAAAVFGVFVYFFEIKGGKPRDDSPTKAEATNPAFGFKSEDITEIKLERGGQTITIENRDGKWMITQPFNAAADQSAVDSIARDVASARIERKLSVSTDDLKSYGLNEPAVSIDVKLNNGEEHRIRLGSKDFSGLTVYAQIEGESDVALLQGSLLSDADKSLEDLRDRSVLGISQYDLATLDLDNENGHIALVKRDADWSLKSPVEAEADDEQVRSLINELTSAKVADFLKENPSELSKYGLDKPRIALTVKLQDGGERNLSIGAKIDGDYYAKSADRSEVFKVTSALYDKLNAKPSELRDKQLVTLDKEALTRLWIRNQNLTLATEKDKDGKWIIKEPADKKDKEAQVSRIFSALETNKASEVLDKAPGSAASKLARPAIELRLTDKNGKVTEIKLSSADGDNVYAQVQGRQGVYKIGKQILDSLNLKVDDLVL
jgi:uncharacterized protein DUF4340